MKFTEIPYHLLKDFLLKAPGVSLIPYSTLTTLSATEVKNYPKTLEREE
jgi:hypothetical protein